MSTLQNTLLSHLRSLAAKQVNAAKSDRQLLEAFLSRRSEAAFAALVQRHGPMVLSVCRRVLHNHHDAEDAFQATFLVFVRKAANIRKRESVSSFLHGVAYHVAANLKLSAARRAARERMQARPQCADPCDELSWGELRSVLDEELTKLPQQYRMPLVLCYLEGKTQDEAARLLGWSKSTFRRRLESGRDRLCRQLTRRGVTLSAALSAPLFADAAAQAALSPLLAANTVRAGLAAATGKMANDLVSAQVVALAESGVASLLAKKTSVVVVLLLLLTLGVGGLLAHRTVGDRTRAKAPAAPPPQSAPARSASKVQAIEEKGDTITVTGRVLDPDGKPFSGAKIYLIGSGDRPKKHPVRAVSGSDGRFHFTFPKTEYFESAWIRIVPEMWHWCDIVAAAPGYGPARVLMSDVKTELSLHLVKETRIYGRVRDLEGRPVEGAEVRAIGLSLSGSWCSLLDAAVADKEGRFRLTGIGRGVEMELRVSAPTIETQWIKVQTPKEGPTVIEVLAGPTKSVEGTVRGRDTGKPLAGVEVLAIPLGFETFFDHPHTLRTVTDERGHYRLVGLPKTHLYKLTVVPPADQGYVITVKQTTDSEGLKPIRLDFNLRRGVIVRLRLIDKETGHPVRGDVRYSPLIDNPLRIEAWKPDDPNLFPGRLINYPHNTGRDDFIQFVAYPGPGVILAGAGWWGPYLTARLDPEDEKNGHYPGPKGDPINGFLDLFSGYRRIDPKPTDRLLVFDIVLDPGRTLKGTLVDPARQPVRGATGWGLKLGMTGREGEQVLETAVFTATGIERDKPCTLSFVHRGRKLIGQKAVQPEDKGPLTVHLQRWGALTGRLVDAEGKLLAGAKMHLKYPDSPDAGMRLPDVEFATDREGRFRVEGLLPDRDHELILGPSTKKGMAPRQMAPSANNVLKKGKTRAGEVKDLGDIVVKVGTGEPSRK